MDGPGEKIRVLMVEDDEDDYLLTYDLFLEVEGARYHVDWVRGYAEALEQISKKSHDVCLLDYRLGEYTGLDLLNEAMLRGCRLPIILMTGQGDKDIDLEAMRSGASDYLVKGKFDASMLERSIRYAIERKRSEEALKLAKTAAEEANRIKTEFLANISHEIRTPINGIMGMAQLTLSTNLTTEQREFLGLIKTSAESLSSIINDILDYSKMSAGKLTLEPVSMNLYHLIKEVMDLERVQINPNVLKLSLKYPKRVPQTVIGDPVRIRQILTNLINNAIKFTSRGRVLVTVGWEERSRENIRYRISVQDTGIGIPSEKLEDIFLKFTQADASTTRRYGGTGLGLAICTQLVELLGGSLGVESQLGKGSTFWFTLPLPIDSQGEENPSLIPDNHSKPLDLDNL